MKSIIVEMMKKAFLNEDLKTINSLWSHMESCDFEDIKSIIRKIPEPALYEFIERVKTVNEYIASEILKMYKEEEVEKTEMKVNVKGTEYTVEELVAECKRNPGFISDMINSVFTSPHPEKIPGLIMEIMMLDQELAQSIQSVLQQTQESLLNSIMEGESPEEVKKEEVKAEDNIEERLKSFQKKWDSMTDSPENFFKGLKDPEIQNMFAEKIPAGLDKISKEGVKIIVAILDKYKELYLESEHIRIEAVKSKAKVLGEFNKALQDNDIDDASVRRTLLSIELERLNKRFQII